MRFTPEQQQAIEARNRELLVSAAAGSGKTAVLVERIVRMIVHDGMSIDRMLIVTFTRAAASEMRERLESRLNEAAGSDQRLRRQADLVSGAQISTIHSYCQQVVRQNFQHCQVDPQFMLADERTRAAFYADAMEETLTYLYEAANGDGDLLSLTSKFAEREISGMMDTLYRFILSRPDPMEWLERSAAKEWDAQTIDGEPMAQAFCQEAAILLEEMRALWEQTAALEKQPAFPPAYRNTLQSDRETIDGLHAACGAGLSSLAAALAGLKFATLGRAKPTTQDEQRLAERYKELRGQYKDIAGELQKLLPADFAQGVRDMAAMGPATRGLAKAVKRLDEAFMARKHEQAVIDFGDLEHMTLSVLREDGARRQQAARFDAVFVDEYQDVSALQEAILNALKRDETDTRPQYFFYVGDVKQSIYRFRLAEPELFLGKLARFSPEADAPQRRIVLNRNFRSRGGVLDAVNRTFSHVMDGRVTEIDYDADARLYPGVPSQNDPQTELHVLASRGRRPQETVLAEAGLIADDILSTVGLPVNDLNGNPCGVLHYRDIAILLPVGKNVSDKVELALTRKGVPVYAEGAGDPLGSDEVTQLTQHLRLMDNLMNDIALLSELRSPLFEMGERELAQIRLTRAQKEASFLSALQAAAQEAAQPLRARCSQVMEVLQRERFYLRSMPLDEYLWSFLSRSGLYAHYGAQPGGRLRQANLRMLCHRAGEYEKCHTDGLHGFVESLAAQTGGGENSPAVINPWEDVVRVMTIHKSKGLEFPTVYVMGLGRSLLGRASARGVSVHGDVGFALGYVNEQARTRRQTLMQGAIALKEKNAGRAERARVLYVAMTRPKNRLVLVGTASEKDMDAGALARRVEEGQNSGGVFGVRTARSMLDWLIQCVQPQDILQCVGPEGFSTIPMRKTQQLAMFPTDSTSFPHKTDIWNVVFHTDPEIARVRAVEGARVPLPLPEAGALPERAAFEPVKPFAPRRPGSARPPLKLGVTALCSALEENQSPSEGAGEEQELKRLPLGMARPRLLGSLPATPAFLEPPYEERALATGVQTHRLLGLLNLAGARSAEADPRAMRAYVESERDRLAAQGVMTAGEAALADCGMAARFLAGPLGQRMLLSPLVKREWSFSLKIARPFETLLQGVIDLCFVEGGAWVLVDFKTDRVSQAEQLWPRYRRQLAYYRQALTRGTPYPVKEMALYSLRLGQAVTKYDEED